MIRRAVVASALAGVRAICLESCKGRGAASTACRGEAGANAVNRRSSSLEQQRSQACEVERQAIHVKQVQEFETPRTTPIDAPAAWRYSEPISLHRIDGEAFPPQPPTRASTLMSGLLPATFLSAHSPLLLSTKAGRALFGDSSTVTSSLRLNSVDGGHFPA